MLKLLKLFNIKNHKRINIVHVFQTLKVLAYTSLILTVIRAVAKQYQEHLDEKKMKNTQLCAHRKNVANLDAMRRSTSTLSEQYFEQMSQHRSSQKGWFGSFSYSPLNDWASRVISRLKSLVGNGYKRKRMTISLKNTILWNPSKDIQSPNHAFNENTVLLLSRLAQAYEVHLVTHTNTSAEKKQIRGLLRNAHIDRSENLRESMVKQVHYCTTEQNKMELLRRLKPSIHIEGGWEMEDGYSIVGQILNGISSVNKLIWVVSNQKRELYYHDESSEADTLEFTDNITHSSLARDICF